MNLSADKPFSSSCVENRDPIRSVLAARLADAATLLEIGSGTGQHAVYLAPDLPQLTWQTSDRAENHPGIRAWLDAEGAANILPPLCLDVLQDPWPDGPYDAVFSANTAHIMPEQAVAAMFAGVGRVLRPGGQFLLYGPFNYQGRFTAESNRRFDAWLQEQDPAMGVRDLSLLQGFGGAASLSLADDIEMPANNRTLVWVRE